MEMSLDKYRQKSFPVAFSFLPVNFKSGTYWGIKIFHDSTSLQK